MVIVSHNRSSPLCIGMVRRKLMLVTLWLKELTSLLRDKSQSDLLSTLTVSTCTN